MSDSQPAASVKQIQEVAANDTFVDTSIPFIRRYRMNRVHREMQQQQPRLHRLSVSIA